MKDQYCLTVPLASFSSSCRPNGLVNRSSIVSNKISYRSYRRENSNHIVSIDRSWESFISVVSVNREGAFFSVFFGAYIEKLSQYRADRGDSGNGGESSRIVNLRPKTIEIQKVHFSKFVSVRPPARLPPQGEGLGGVDGGFGGVTPLED